jgi:hypothetical protein
MRTISGFGVLVLHDQGLDHGVLGDIQLARGNARAAMLLVLVEVVGMGDPVLVQELGRRGFGSRIRVAVFVSHGIYSSPLA